MGGEQTAAPAGAGANGGRAGWMTLGGVALLLFAAVHTVWTGFHAPLAAWVAPLGLGLLAGGLWSRAAQRPLPRWATAVLALLALVLAGLLVWTLIYAVTRQDTVV